MAGAEKVETFAPDGPGELLIISAAAFRQSPASFSSSIAISSFQLVAATSSHIRAWVSRRAATLASSDMDEQVPQSDVAAVEVGQLNLGGR